MAKLVENHEPTIQTGYDMFYSQNYVDKKFGLAGYTNVVHIYNVDGGNTPTTYKSHSLIAALDYLKHYDDTERLFRMDENSNQKYVGTRCCGEAYSKRCHAIIPPEGTTKYCPGCRENMKAYLG